ncbi:hypothetical protein Vafri_18670 [Volvox africanus]|uniref:Uncharacterized protein n=1 Tax=Volvox africanus TaxID=51714 RepID=A0A8J4FBD1_9CHLO|nr:hypothetical protein Vafri_18670 [Volvox africanus]
MVYLYSSCQMEMSIYVKNHHIFISDVAKSSAPWSGIPQRSVHWRCCRLRNGGMTRGLVLSGSVLKEWGFDVLRSSQSATGLVGCGEDLKHSVEAAEVVATLNRVSRSVSIFLAMCCLGIQLALVSPSPAVMTAPDRDTFENVPSQLSSSVQERRRLCR